SVPQADDFVSDTGSGVHGLVADKKVKIGKASYVGIGAEHEARANELRREGKTVIYVGIGGAPAGLIATADPIKETTREAIAGLQADGIEIVMATGDAEATAKAVAAQLGIDRVEAGVMPADKSALVQRLKKEGKVVAMAGDGVNDAPAL